MFVPDHDVVEERATSEAGGTVVFPRGCWRTSLSRSLSRSKLTRVVLDGSFSGMVCQMFPSFLFLTSETRRSGGWRLLRAASPSHPAPRTTFSFHPWRGALSSKKTHEQRLDAGALPERDFFGDLADEASQQPSPSDDDARLRTFRRAHLPPPSTPGVLR